MQIRKNINLNKLQSVLRRFYHMTPLDLYSSSGILSWRRSRTLSDGNYSDNSTSLSSLHSHIFSNRFVRASAVMAIFMLVFLTSAILVPLYSKLDITEATTGTAKESSLSFNLTNSTASVDLSVNDNNGTFASSSDDNSKVKFNISTTNYTGYTLSIKGNDNNRQLVNSTNSNIKLNSISSTINYDSFNSNSDYNNLWGYLPSSYYSNNTNNPNTNYRPAPTASGETLAITSSPNTTANSYTIGIGARASYTTPAGEYTGTYVLTAVANDIAYYIAFNDNTNDSTVANLPTAISSSVSTTSVTLPSTTPTRTGYTFKSWCLGTVSNNGTTCTGTQFNKSSSFGLDQTTTNGTNTAPVNLYALWTINSYNVSITNGSNITSSSGSGTYDYGSTVNLSATKATNTTCLTYSNPSWSVTSGGVSLSTYTGASTSFTMPNNAVTVSVSSTVTRNTYTITYNSNGGTGTMNNTTASCGVSTALRSNSFTKSGYTFLGWSTSPTATSATYTNGQSITLSQTSTLNLYAVWRFDGPNMQNLVANSCTTSGVQVKDTRDGTVYTVKKLADGKCWMLENLRLNIADDTILSGMSASNTHATAAVLNYLKGTSTGAASNQYATSKVANWTSTSYSYSDPWIAVNSSTSGLCANVTYCVDSTNKTWSSISSTSTTNSGADKYPGKIGIYYNYCAATAGSYCYGSGTSYGTPSGNAQYDICPSGWRLPTGGSSGEFQALYTAYSSNYANFRNALQVPLSGYFLSGVAYDQGYYGHYWSSTFHHTNSMYSLNVDTSNVLPMNGNYRDSGLSIRCVLGS